MWKEIAEQLSPWEDTKKLLELAQELVSAGTWNSKNYRAAKELAARIPPRNEETSTNFRSVDSDCSVHT
jgi:hypothetical protein